MTHTKESIMYLLLTNDHAVGRALAALNKRQTADERAHTTTKYKNGRGFNASHAKRGTDMAVFYGRFGYLTDRQVGWWRSKAPGQQIPRICMYAGQLLEVAQEKEATKLQGVRNG